MTVLKEFCNFLEILNVVLLYVKIVPQFMNARRTLVFWSKCYKLCHALPQAFFLRSHRCLNTISHCGFRDKFALQYVSIHHRLEKRLPRELAIVIVSVRAVLTKYPKLAVLETKSGCWWDPGILVGAQWGSGKSPLVACSRLLLCIVPMQETRAQEASLSWILCGQYSHPRGLPHFHIATSESRVSMCNLAGQKNLSIMITLENNDLFRNTKFFISMFICMILNANTWFLEESRFLFPSSQSPHWFSKLQFLLPG